MTKLKPHHRLELNDVFQKEIQFHFKLDVNIFRIRLVGQKTTRVVRPQSPDRYPVNQLIF